MMRDSWSHDPHKRPKFKDLRLKLRAIRPEEVIYIYFLNYNINNHSICDINYDKCDSLWDSKNPKIYCLLYLFVGYNNITD